MGFLKSWFSRAPKVADDVWYPDGTGVEPGGDAGLNGAYGGPFQRGDSFSVRLWNDAYCGAAVDLITYAAEYSDMPGVFYCTLQVEWRLCDDRNQAARTETWGDRCYFDLDQFDHDTDATAAARNLAMGFAWGAWWVHGDYADEPMLDSLDEATLNAIFCWDGDPQTIDDVIPVEGHRVTVAGPEAPAWAADSEPERTPSHLVADGNGTSSDAYQVRFALPGTAALIWVWLYACACPETGGAHVAARYEYQVQLTDNTTWSCAGYREADDPWLYRTTTAADRAAQYLAAALAGDQDAVAVAEQNTLDALAGIFDWDGEPLDPEAEEAQP
jgi:hypothetical protein